MWVYSALLAHNGWGTFCVRLPVLFVRLIRLLITLSDRLRCKSRVNNVKSIILFRARAVVSKLFLPFLYLKNIECHLCKYLGSLFSDSGGTVSQCLELHFVSY